MSRLSTLVTITLLIAAAAQAEQPSPEQIRICQEQAKSHQVESHVRIIRLALDKLAKEQPDAFNKLPVPLHDSLPWWLQQKPAAEWSPELQRFVLDQFQERANESANTNPDLEKIRRWLAEPAPLANA